jgi:hypothetical protein
MRPRTGSSEHRHGRVGGVQELERSLHAVERDDEGDAAGAELQRQRRGLARADLEREVEGVGRRLDRS